MITPRRTRLIRVADLAAFRGALVALAFDGPPLAARDRLIVVPTRAAAALLTAELERRCAPSSAILRPELVTPRDLPGKMAERSVPSLIGSREEAREVLMGVACRGAAEINPPPFRLRPGLVAEALGFYDSLLRHRKDLATFERLTLARLEPGAEYDRGAERLVRQTRFLVDAFVRFETLSTANGLVDEHRLRAAVLEHAAARPWRHVIVTVADDSRDRHGLCAADWDLLTRVSGLEQLDVVVTDQTLAGAWHEQVHDLLPGIEEERFEVEPGRRLVLRVPDRSVAASASASASRRHVSPRSWLARDREEEVADFARWTRAMHRADQSLSLDRIALVVRQPLPYVYLAREVLRSANVPCQTLATLPLAAEPYVAALDLVLAAVSSGMARSAAIALLTTPHFRWNTGDGELSRMSAAAADAVLSERGYLGGIEALTKIVVDLRSASSSRTTDALQALTVLLAAASELDPLRIEAPAATHLEVLLRFLREHDAPVAGDDRVRSRHLRSRAAVHGMLTTLSTCYRQLDPQPGPFDQVAATVRRWIEAHTSAPGSGERGVHLIDAASARFGEFDHVQLAGLVDGEWPVRSRRNVFYSGSLLRDLGWSAESEHLEFERAAFVDLLRLPSSTLTVSTFSLEDDVAVASSPLLETVDLLEVAASAVPRDVARIFELEVLGLEPVAPASLDAAARTAAEHRLSRTVTDGPGFHGQTAGYTPTAYSLSGLERYQDCPFRFFANDVLRLREIPDDEPFLTPRARGRFVHELFERFFEAWDARGTQTITADNVADARALFEQVAVPMLARLGQSDAALERARLFGSAVAVGIVDVVLGLEASRPDTVRERWLESSFEGDYRLGEPGGPAVPIRGIVDRVDLLEGNRLRVIDYKTGYAPAPSRALQVPIYALCARDQAEQRDGRAWSIAEAAYIAFSGKRALVPIATGNDGDRGVLADARERLLEQVRGIEGGEFPPRPHDTAMCRTCAFPAVCRKDYVHT